jgi:hypothetical protein
MGINLSFIGFFDCLKQQHALRGPMIGLGSLEIQEPLKEIQAFAEKNLYWNLGQERNVRSLFRDRYGVTDYRDCDLNDKADIKLDFNKPITPGLFSVAMTVLNGGTIEHVFDIAQAMVNIHNMAQPEATIIHLAPISWYNHGYYNFNPYLFASIAQVNKYRLLAEAFHFKSNELHITFDGRKPTEQTEKIEKMFSTASIPSNALYMVAYRKATSREFLFPYDVKT